MDGGKFLTESAKGEGELVFDGTLGDVQFFGDLPVADLVDPAEDEHFLTSFGQAAEDLVYGAAQFVHVLLQFGLSDHAHGMGRFDLDLVELAVSQVIVALIPDGPIEIGFDIPDVHLPFALPIINPYLLYQILG